MTLTNGQSTRQLPEWASEALGGVSSIMYPGTRAEDVIWFLSQTRKERDALKVEVNRLRHEVGEPNWKYVPESGSGSASDSGNDLFALEDSPALPEDVFPQLPDLLRKAAGTFNRSHKRDVFLTSAIGTLSGCMPQVGGYYGGSVPRLLHPNLYVGIVGPSTGGKGSARDGSHLASEANVYVKEKSEAAIERWKNDKEKALSEGEAFDEPQPPKRSLCVPVDSSAAHIFRSLKRNGERGLLTTHEIDELTATLGQDWGNFSGLLRLAYHHESKGYGRVKEEEGLWLEDPQLSVVLVGTPAQYANLMRSAENGLYSRFALYYFNTTDPWQPQRPTAEGIEHRQMFDEWAREVRRMYRQLNRRRELLRFEMRNRHWNAHNECFGPLQRFVRQEGLAHLTSVVRRAGVIAFRITMILTVIRAFASGVELDEAEGIVAEDVDAETGLILARYYADHALRFATAKLEGGTPDAQSRRIAVMLRGVEEQFRSGDAYKVAEDAGLEVSQRTLGKDLKVADDRGLIRAVTDNGCWKKVRHDANE